MSKFVPIKFKFEPEAKNKVPDAPQHKKIFIYFYPFSTYFILIMRVKNFSLSFGLQLFKAFSEEARVRILFLLYMEKEMCITDLEQVLDFTQTKTSRHLQYLKHANLVSDRKVDQFVYYRVKIQAKDIVHQLFQYMNKDAILLKDMETYRILYSNRELAVCKLHQRKWMQN